MRRAGASLSQLLRLLLRVLLRLLLWLLLRLQLRVLLRERRLLSRVDCCDTSRASTMSALVSVLVLVLDSPLTLLEIYKRISRQYADISAIPRYTYQYC